jgi:hypothetical protein
MLTLKVERRRRIIGFLVDNHRRSLAQARTAPEIAHSKKK